MRLIKLILLVILLKTSSCIDAFVPETVRYDHILFIECLLSDDTSQQQLVKISYSTPILSELGSGELFVPEKATGAQVKVIDNYGESFDFIELTPGQYSAANLSPEVGKAYQLNILYKGDHMESAFETLKQSPPIDSISFKHVLERLSENGDIYDGYRFYASTHEDQAGPSYYRWESEATYLFRVPYDATHIWDGRRSEK